MTTNLGSARKNIGNGLKQAERRFDEENPFSLSAPGVTVEGRLKGFLCGRGRPGTQDFGVWVFSWIPLAFPVIGKLNFSLLFFLILCFNFTFSPIISGFFFKSCCLFCPLSPILVWQS